MLFRSRMVRIYFDAGNLDKAESEVFNFADRNTPHQYWLAKSFMVLADIYAKRNDFFQAKATLQSVIDGYSVPSDGVIDQASKQLTELIKTEKEKQRGSSNDTIQLQWQ